MSCCAVLCLPHDTPCCAVSCYAVPCLPAQVGKFYEAAGVDAIMLHEHCGMNFMGAVANLQVCVQQPPHSSRPASEWLCACP